MKQDSGIGQSEQKDYNVVMSKFGIKNFKKGFTLIELLVVIAIISILTTITVSQFQTAKKKANDVARKGDLNSLSKSLQMYFADYGVFPSSTTVTGGRMVVNGTTVNWGDAFQDNTVSPAYIYMKKTPRENYLTSKPYCYKVSADNKKFGLFAQLESAGDLECSHSCTCGTNTYCYGIASPNTSLNSDGSLQ